MQEQIALINVRPVWARLPLAVLALAALYGAWYGVRWGMGNTMAETAPSSYANDPTASFESAEAAVRLAPRDPLAHLMLARLNQISFDPAGVPRALEEYAAAAALAPNDYLVWTEVGRARSALGDAEGGVAALRRAVELAPNYAQPRWHLGNALLRRGEIEEGFAELRRASEADSSLRPQVFNLAWQVYGPDMTRVIDSVGKTALARAQLVGVLAGRGRFDDAQAVWASLSPEERRTHATAGDALARALYGRGQQRRALRLLSESGVEGIAEGKVSNGGFESDIGQPGLSLFQWDVTQAPGAQIAVDARAGREGRRALRVVFNASGQVDFRNVSQVVAIEPAARYRLTFWVKTEGLKSGRPAPRLCRGDHDARRGARRLAARARRDERLAAGLDRVHDGGAGGGRAGAARARGLPRRGLPHLRKNLV